jgi:hypothetical protein
LLHQPCIEKSLAKRQSSVPRLCNIFQIRVPIDKYDEYLIGLFQFLREMNEEEKKSTNLRAHQILTPWLRLFDYSRPSPQNTMFRKLVVVCFFFTISE